MLMQNFGVTNKEYIILCYGIFCSVNAKNKHRDCGIARKLGSG